MRRVGHQHAGDAAQRPRGRGDAVQLVPDQQQIGCFTELAGRRHGLPGADLQLPAVVFAKN